MNPFLLATLRNAQAEEPTEDSTATQLDKTTQRLLGEIEEEPVVEPSPEPEPEEEEEIDPQLASSETIASKPVKKVLQKGPSKARVLYEDGTEGWESKEDVIRYL